MASALVIERSEVVRRWIVAGARVAYDTFGGVSGENNARAFEVSGYPFGGVLGAKKG